MNSGLLWVLTRLLLCLQLLQDLSTTRSSSPQLEKYRSSHPRAFMIPYPQAAELETVVERFQATISFLRVTLKSLSQLQRRELPLTSTNHLWKTLILEVTGDSTGGRTLRFRAALLAFPISLMAPKIKLTSRSPTSESWMSRMIIILSIEAMPTHGLREGIGTMTTHLLSEERPELTLRDHIIKRSTMTDPREAMVGDLANRMSRLHQAEEQELLSGQLTLIRAMPLIIPGRLRSSPDPTSDYLSHHLSLCK